MFERFTQAARSAVVDAQEHCRALGHDQIGAQHVLLGAVGDAAAIPARVLGDLGVEREAVLGVVRDRGFADAEALASLGIDLDEVRRRAEQTFGPDALGRSRRPRRRRFGRARDTGGHIPFDTEAKRSLELALRAAVAERHGYVGVEHLLLGLLDARPGTALTVLQRAGLTADPAEVRRRVLTEIRRAA